MKKQVMCSSSPVTGFVSSVKIHSQARRDKCGPNYVARISEKLTEQNSGTTMYLHSASGSAMAWYDEVFDGKYDRFTFNRFTPELNEREADFIRTALQLRRGDEVLDLACGHGRHAVPLARRGIKITGLDITARYLEMARRAAEDLPIEFIQGDMREIEWEERFDAAYCYFTSFGFFDDETNLDVLRRLARALRPGGRLLIDTQNREQYCSGDVCSQEFFEFEEGGEQFALLSYSTFDLETSEIRVRSKLYGTPDGPEEMRFSVRLYTLAEMRSMMKRVGLEVTAHFGDSDASPYGLNSPRMIVVGELI